MKLPIKIFITMSFIMISFNSFAQLDHFPLFIGSTKELTLQYLDSLDMIKDAPMASIDKRSGVSDLVYMNDFAITDEDYYKCLSVFVSFHNFNGTDICVTETVSGTTSKADANSNYLKNNFTAVSDKRWERPFMDGKHFKIGVFFEPNFRLNYYSLRYDLIQLPETNAAN